MGSVAFPQRRNVGSIACQHNRIKDLVLPLLWHRLQMQLRSDHWPGSSKCYIQGGRKGKGRDSRDVNRTREELTNRTVEKMRSETAKARKCTIFVCLDQAIGFMVNEMGHPWRV